MRLRQLQLRLKEEGYGDVPVHIIRHAVEFGHISLPPRDWCNKRVYSEQHVTEMAAYLNRRESIAHPTTTTDGRAVATA